MKSNVNFCLALTYQVPSDLKILDIPNPPNVAREGLIIKRVMLFYQEMHIRNYRYQNSLFYNLHPYKRHQFA